MRDVILASKAVRSFAVGSFFLRLGQPLGAISLFTMLVRAVRVMDTNYLLRFVAFANQVFPRLLRYIAAAKLVSANPRNGFFSAAE